MLPLMNLTMTIPAVITTNTTARATDMADVYLNESAQNNKRSQEVMNINGGVQIVHLQCNV